MAAETASNMLTGYENWRSHRTGGMREVHPLLIMALAAFLTGACIPLIGILMAKAGFVEPFDIEFGRLKWEIRPWRKK